MVSFLSRSNSTTSTLQSTSTSRSTIPLPNPYPSKSPSTPKTLNMRSGQSSGLSDSPTEASRPVRPKSTLGFSSKFALSSWKSSIRSTTSSHRSVQPSEPIIGPPADISNVDEVDISKKAKIEGGMKRLRRRISMEWWDSRFASTAPPQSIISTPTTPVPDLTLAKTSQPTKPLRPHAQTSRIQPNNRDSVRPPDIPSNPQPEPPDSPGKRAIHTDWRAQAREIGGDMGWCLNGAICLAITNPLEGIKEAYIDAYAPRRPAIRLVTSRTTIIPTTPTHTRAYPLPAHYSSSTNQQPVITPPKSTQRSSRIPTSPTPSSQSRQKPKSNPVPAPLSRRPLVSRRTIDISSARQTYTPVPQSTNLDEGVTPRSSRRVRNSLKMTPMAHIGVKRIIPQPDSYIPLKSPAASPRHSPILTPPNPHSRGQTGINISPVESTRTSLNASISSTEKSSSTGGSFRRFGSDGSISTGSFGVITPPLRDGDGVRGENMGECRSGWAVVGPTSQRELDKNGRFGAKGNTKTEVGDWVVTSPIKRPIR